MTLGKWRWDERTQDWINEAPRTWSPPFDLTDLDSLNGPNFCTAGKHDLDEVGVVEPGAARLKQRPNAKPQCRGCWNLNQHRRRAKARIIIPTVNRVRIYAEQDPAEYVDSGFGGTQQKLLGALLGDTRKTPSGADPSLPWRTQPWMQYGLCRDASIDRNVFWDPRQVAEAREVCADCYFQPQCREYAIDNDERVGVWGGTTPAERHVTRLTREIA